MFVAGANRFHDSSVPDYGSLDQLSHQINQDCSWSKHFLSFVKHSKLQNLSYPTSGNKAFPRDRCHNDALVNSKEHNRCQ